MLYWDHRQRGPTSHDNLASYASAMGKGATIYSILTSRVSNLFDLDQLNLQSPENSTTVSFVIELGQLNNQSPEKFTHIQLGV